MGLAMLFVFVLSAVAVNGDVQLCVDGDEPKQAQGGVLLQTKTAKATMELPSARNLNVFASTSESDGQYASVQGEFHRVVLKSGNVEEMLENPKCRNFYARDDSTPSPTVVDHALRLFRPASEMLTQESLEEPTLPTAVFKRLQTYEDVAFPKDFHDTNVTGTVGTTEDFHKERFCEMFAIRTPQRPVKVITAQVQGNSKQNLTMPAIWKVATTSMTQILKDAGVNGSLRVLGPHGAGTCGSNPLEQCEKYTSFHQEAVNSTIKAALVRSPLDRFMASVNEHGAWPTCTVDGTEGQVCGDMIEAARTMATKLGQDFPHKYRSCEHPSQVYFLSATDLQGEPYHWDAVMRLETFDDALKQVNAWTGVELSRREDNTSGEQDIKKKYFDAIFSDLKTLCSVCKVYAQDFECLGYAKPDKCTPTACSTVGVELPNMW